MLTAVLQDLGFWLNLKAVLYLQTSVINQKIGKAFPKPRKAEIVMPHCSLKTAEKNNEKQTLLKNSNNKMTEKEQADILNWNFVVGMYSNVKDKIKEPLGSVQFVEAMLKEAKLIEIVVAENFSRESFDTVVQVHYEIHKKRQP